MKIRFADQLKITRKERGITQKELNTKCGLNPAYISKVEALGDRDVISSGGRMGQYCKGTDDLY